MIQWIRVEEASRQKEDDRKANKTTFASTEDIPYQLQPDATQPPPAVESKSMDNVESELNKEANKASKQQEEGE
jgi:hypothetical protein